MKLAKAKFSPGSYQPLVRSHQVTFMAMPRESFLGQSCQQRQRKCAGTDAGVEGTHIHCLRSLTWHASS